MVDVSTVYGSGKYLKAEDLHGRDVTVQIASAEVVKMDEGMKVCIYFNGKEKGLLLNKTNSTTISSMYGHQTDNWIGKPITIGMSWVDFQGSQVQAIRVRPVVAGGNGFVDHQAPPGHQPQQPTSQERQQHHYSEPTPVHHGAPAPSRDLDDEVPFAPQVL